jgi:hypothetical protein
MIEPVGRSRSSGLMESMATDSRWVETFEVHCADLGAVLIVDRWEAEGVHPEFRIRGADSIRSCPEDGNKFLVECGGYLFEAHRIHR